MLLFKVQFDFLVNPNAIYYVYAHAESNAMLAAYDQWVKDGGDDKKAINKITIEFLDRAENVLGEP